MGIILYGTKTFSKLLGYAPAKETCTNCGKTYKKAIVRYRTWAHLDYIPLFPVKSTYFKMCPVCGNGIALNGKEAKEELDAAGNQETQSIDYYAKHILASKPNGLLSADRSYEFWMRDNLTGEEFCIKSGLTKDDVKKMKKGRGIKAFQYVNVE